MSSSGPESTEDQLFRVLRGLREQAERPAYPPTSESPLPSIPRYDIQAILGEGATSTVYRAWDRTLGRTVALKVLRDRSSYSATARERFRREAQAAAGLSHPNVVLVHDAGEADGRPYLVMEAVEGRPLRQVLEDPAVALAHRVHLLEKAARGLQAAHAKQIVHRDVKPANILVTAQGEPKVADFGLAHVASTEAGLTRTGAALGTPLYMAPEQVAGRSKDVSPRTDVYAMGAILYEILTDRPPHESETMVDLYARIAREDPVPPRRVRPDAPADLEKVALKALARNPQERYPEAGGFADDLERWRKQEPVGAVPVPEWRRRARRIARSPAAAVVALVLAALGSVGFAAVRAAATRERQARALALLESSKRPLEQAERLLRKPEATYASLLERLAPAEPLVAEARALAPELPLVAHREGELWELKGYPDRAAERFEEARRLAPDFAPARFRLGRLLLARAYLVNLDMMVEPKAATAARAEALAGRAVAEFEAVRAQGSGLDDALQREIVSAMLAFLRRDKEEVLRLCEAALKRFATADGVEELHWLLGLGAPHKTPQLEHLDEALRLRPKSPLILFSRARARQLSNDRPGALVDLDAAVEFSPDFAEAYVRRGSIRAYEGDPEGAMADFERLIGLGRILEGAYNGRGWIRLRQGDMDGALADFDQAIRLNPEYFFLPYYHRALVWEQKGQRRKALQDVERALALHAVSTGGTYDAGLILRARLRVGEADLEGAKADIDAVLKVNPRHPEALKVAEAVQGPR